MNTVPCDECGQDMITSQSDPDPDVERYCPEHRHLDDRPGHGAGYQCQQARDVRANYNRQRVIDNDRGRF